jgi:regulator of protease activity HflC (stomatin/prohibitin superfamily)
MEQSQVSTALHISERPAFALPGLPALILGILSLAGAVYTISQHNIALFVPAIVVAVLALGGLMVVGPNEARVVIFFGRYVGSVRASGLFWTNPFTVRRLVSLRVRNFSSEKLKVNDSAGSPVEIAAVVVWKVEDTARALFSVDDYPSFVSLQAETALRALATRYPYDSPDAAITLLGAPDEIAHDLQEELRLRLGMAGVQVLEARLSHLAYAPEVAQAMLRRQQAQAVVAARRTIVSGAVGMVEEALASIAEKGLVDLDEERKAQMVNNLLVALTAEQPTQPVINTGTLYS